MGNCIILDKQKVDEKFVKYKVVINYHPLDVVVKLFLRPYLGDIDFYIMKSDAEHISAE